MSTSASVSVPLLEPEEALKNLLALGLPERANLALGQDPRSVLYQAPATEPHNYADMLKEGHLLPHPSGRFVRP